MFSIFFKKNYKKLSFEDIQFVLVNKEQFMLINTLAIEDQGCLIPTTIEYMKEEEIINNCIKNYELSAKKIVIYGRNNTDESIIKKYNQLSDLGFNEIYLYVGGLFEWLLMQDVYGNEYFPTTRPMLDILKYKPERTFGSRLLL